MISAMLIAMNLSHEKPSHFSTITEQDSLSVSMCTIYIKVFKSFKLFQLLHLIFVDFVHLVHAQGIGDAAVSQAFSMPCCKAPPGCDFIVNSGTTDPTEHLRCMIHVSVLRCCLYFEQVTYCNPLLSSFFSHLDKKNQTALVPCC